MLSVISQRAYNLSEVFQARHRIDEFTDTTFQSAPATEVKDDDEEIRIWDGVACFNYLLSHSVLCAIGALSPAQN
jgi:hypothetical protein